MGELAGALKASTQEIAALRRLGAEVAGDNPNGEVLTPKEQKQYEEWKSRGYLALGAEIIEQQSRIATLEASLKEAEECLRLLLSHLQVTDTRTMAGTIRPAMKVKLAHSIDAAVDYEKASAYFDRHKEE